MTNIEKFVNDLFKNIKITNELESQKNELVDNLQDKYNELIQSGMTENDAQNKVINDFGSIEEFRNEFGLIELNQKNKLRRSKKIIITICTVTLIALLMFTYQYYRSREFVAQDLEKLAQQINMIDMRIDENYKPRSSDSYIVYDTIHNIQDFHDVIYRDMNLFERHKYESLDHHFYLSWFVSGMHEKLALRNDIGYWNSLDDEVYNRYISFTETLLYIIEKEEFRLRGMELDGDWSDKNKLNAFFSKLDIDSISDAYYNLNMLAATYVLYDCLPDDIQLLDGDVLSQKLAPIFGNATYTFNRLNSQGLIMNGLAITGRIESNELNNFIKIDSVNGKILAIQDGQTQYEKGKEQEVYDIEDVRSILNMIFGKNFDYQIRYLEESNTFSSNRPYYSYEIIPFYNNFPFYYPNNPSEIHFSRYSINEFSVFETSFLPTISEIGETELNFEQIIALNNVLIKQKSYIDDFLGYEAVVEDFKYQKTAFVKSTATSHYDLMHVYINSKTDSTLFIHTETGIAE